MDTRKFVVGMTVTDGTSKEYVIKRTQCYVWLTYCRSKTETTKLKIRVDANGNEYAIYRETGSGPSIYVGGNACYVYYA